NSPRCAIGVRTGMGRSLVPSEVIVLGGGIASEIDRLVAVRRDRHFDTRENEVLTFRSAADDAAKREVRRDPLRRLGTPQPIRRPASLLLGILHLWKQLADFYQVAGRE